MGVLKTAGPSTAKLSLSLLALSVVLGNSLDRAQAQPPRDKPCVILLSNTLGQQRPLLERIKIVRKIAGVPDNTMPIAEFAWDNPRFQKIISDAFHIKEYQLPLASTGYIDSDGIPTSANQNRPSLQLPQDVIAYYLINEWSRRADMGFYPWPYEVPPTPAHDLPKTRTCDRDGSVMLLVPAGEFWRGSTEGEVDELPPQRVAVNSVYVGKYEVTVGQYARFVAASGYKTDAEERGFGFVWSASEDSFEKAPGANWRNPDGDGALPDDQHPVRQLSLKDSQLYCEWAGLRLPTESEWEKAARGIGGRQYPWGNSWDKSYAVCQSSRPLPVGSHPKGASPYGLLDAAGNVREWTSSLYEPYSNVIPDTASGQRYSIRGGSFTQKYPQMELRASYRYNSVSNIPNNLTGFRVASGLDSPLGQRPLGPVSSLP